MASQKTKSSFEKAASKSNAKKGASSNGRIALDGSGKKSMKALGRGAKIPCASKGEGLFRRALSDR